jgi:type II secretory pathway pseudopilin PulG
MSWSSWFLAVVFAIVAVIGLSEYQDHKNTQEQAAAYNSRWAADIMAEAYKTGDPAKVEAARIYVKAELDRVAADNAR